MTIACSRSSRRRAVRAGTPTAARARTRRSTTSHAPYVPAATLGQGAFARTGQGWSADYLGAVMLGSHVTFFRDLTEYSDAELTTAARWVALYKRYRVRFTQLAFPPLDDPLPGDTWTGLQW